MTEPANLPEQTPQLPAEGQQPEAQAAPSELPELSDEQIASLFEKKFNFKGDMEAIKQKFAPAPVEPTDEEKSAKELAADKRYLDIYTSHGHTIEEYSALKSFLKEDDLAFGKKLAEKELIDSGFTKEEAEAEIKNRYYQLELEGLDKDDYDSDEDFEKAKTALQKKIDFGNKKLANKSLAIKKQTEGIFSALKQAVENEDLQKQKEIELSSKVDEHISKMPRKLTLELGESDGRKLAPIAYDVSDNDIAEIAQVLKDPSKRDDVFYDKEGNVNIAATAKHLLNEKTMQNLLKASYLTGETRMTQVFRSQYPATSAAQVGVNGAPHYKDTRPGKIVKVGQPRVGSFPQTN